MKITDVNYIPVYFDSSETVGYAQVCINGVLKLYDIAVQIKDDGIPRVVFPTRISTRKRNVRSFFQVDGLLRKQIDAAVIEQYELCTKTSSKHLKSRHTTLDGWQYSNT